MEFRMMSVRLLHSRPDKLYADSPPHSFFKAIGGPGFQVITECVLTLRSGFFSQS
jgi:hypothetical protein